ncbi:MAG: hypothetical protein ACYDAO_06280 [Thermoplasmataceae archaeon]
MKENDELISEGDVRSIANRALEFDFYIFRKAYGTYYAVWATAIFLFVFLPYIIFTLLPPNAQEIAFITIYVSIGLVAMSSTTRIFSKAARIIEFKKVMSKHEKRNKWGKIIDYSILLFFTIIIVLISMFGLLDLAEILIFYGFQLTISIYIFLNLSHTFEKIPIEGIVALTAFLISIIISLLSFLIESGNPLYFSLSWLPAIIGWYFASAYAFYASSHQLEV